MLWAETEATGSHAVSGAAFATAHGEAPEIRKQPTFSDEVRAIVDFVQSGEVKRTCLVTRTNSMLEQYEADPPRAGEAIRDDGDPVPVGVQRAHGGECASDRAGWRAADAGRWR